MANIKLHPEDSIFVPGKGLEKELADIIQEYAVVLTERGIKFPFDVAAFSKFNKAFEHAFDDTYDYIENAANNGDVAAEKTLTRIKDLLDYDYPNYFVIQKDVKANMRAAAFGDVYSQGMLGDRYYHGNGVDKNYRKAVYWYKIAAEQGVGLAQYNLAGCYELGRGVEKDPDKALEWYKGAAELGVREAKRALRRIELETSLSEEELLPYLPTYIWEGERDRSWKDEYGVEYSEDGKRLIEAPSDIKEYVIREGTQVICDGAFGRCEKLASVIFPESVVIIGGWTFKGCRSLKTISLPLYLREIGESAFEWTRLKHLVIPEHVEIIGDAAFSECEEMKSLSISKSVREIGVRAFAWNKALKSIRISPDNNHFDSRNDCNAIIETKSDTLITGCRATMIPQSVKAIGNNAFFGCHSLKTIEIPTGVEYIGDKAFFRCEGMEKVVMADNVKKICREAFEECDTLKDILLSTTLEEIGNKAFKECHSLVQVQLPGSLKVIGDKAFANCFNMTSLVVPNGVTLIGDGAFEDCSNLKEAFLSDSVKKIGDNLFCGCNKLSSISIPSGVKIIGRFSFQYCEGITKVIIPEGVEIIEEGAFDNCDAIEVVLKGDNTDIVGSNAEISKGTEKYVKDILRKVRIGATGKPIYSKGCKDTPS